MTSTIIDVSSPKGGVGKNITNANLDIGLANGGKVLLVAFVLTKRIISA